MTMLAACGSSGGRSTDAGADGPAGGDGGLRADSSSERAGAGGTGGAPTSGGSGGAIGGGGGRIGSGGSGGSGSGGAGSGAAAVTGGGAAGAGGGAVDTSGAAGAGGAGTGGGPQICTPNRAYCRDGMGRPTFAGVPDPGTYSCDATGTGLVQTGTCQSNQYCMSGQCAARFCQPGQPFCIDQLTLGVCNDFGGGTTSTTSCIDSSQICAAAACTAPLYYEGFEEPQSTWPPAQFFDHWAEVGNFPAGSPRIGFTTGGAPEGNVYADILYNSINDTDQQGLVSGFNQMQPASIRWYGQCGNDCRVVFQWVDPSTALSVDFITVQTSSTYGLVVNNGTRRALSINRMNKFSITNISWTAQTFDLTVADVSMIGVPFLAHADSLLAMRLLVTGQGTEGSWDGILMLAP
jgi:hypothetical protein